MTPVRPRAPDAASDDRPWTRRFRRVDSPRIRLFCFPHAGGGASAYASWHQLLPADVEVCPVQLPGREERLLEPAFERVAPLVERLGRALDNHLELPFALFGHSMGALIAFELARMLRRERGLQPRHLFVSAARAPHTPSTLPVLYDLPDQEFVREVRTHYDGIPAEVLENEEAMRLFVPRLKSDFGIFDTYRYAEAEPLGCPITGFGGRDDSSVTGNQLEAWRDLTTSVFELHWLPGDHLYLQSQRERIVSVVGHYLAAAGVDSITPPDAGESRLERA